MKSAIRARRARISANDEFVVVVAGSFGALPAVAYVLGGLPSDFAAAVVIGLHVSRESPNHLVEVLQRHTRLRVLAAADDAPLEAGTIYTPLSDRHTVLRCDRSIAISRGPRICFARPSADVLFRSAAETFGERTIAVVLSGTGSDGTSGVDIIRSHGGFVIAQDANTSICFDMPRSAIETRRVDLVLPVGQIAFALNTLVMGLDRALGYGMDSRPAIARTTRASAFAAAAAASAPPAAH